jgi:hypothetical protein
VFSGGGVPQLTKPQPATGEEKRNPKTVFTTPLNPLAEEDSFLGVEVGKTLEKVDAVTSPTLVIISYLLSCNNSSSVVSVVILTAFCKNFRKFLFHEFEQSRITRIV